MSASDHSRPSHSAPVRTFVRFGPKATISGKNSLVGFVPILLQKSQIAERQFFRQKTRQEVIAA